MTFLISVHYNEASSTSKYLKLCKVKPSAGKKHGIFSKKIHNEPSTLNRFSALQRSGIYLVLILPAVTVFSLLNPPKTAIN